MSYPHLESDRQSLPQRAWEILDNVPQRPTGCDFGYVSKGKAVCCTKEELISTVTYRGVPKIELVWTPDSPELVFPEKAPALTVSFKKRATKEAQTTIAWGLSFLAFIALLAILAEDWRYLYRSWFGIFAMAALIEGTWAIYRARHFSREDAEVSAGAERFTAWLKDRPLTGYSVTLAACIIVVGVAQILAGDIESINAAGLVKPAVRQGEVWRLFTCTLMHVDFVHIWMNFLAMVHIARIIEHTINRALVPAVFLLSGVCGSLLSVLFYPNSTSVGASGGIMGLIGFLTISALLDREKYPPKYLRILIETIIVVAMVGAIGFAFIDNGAHLGGLAAGAVLGWLLIKNTSVIKLKYSRAWMGVLSLILIVFTALVAIYKMFE